MVALEYPVAESLRPSREPRLKVGVLVDLELGVAAGGHVKCWERLAQAARAFPDLIDLTVHFTGRERRIERKDDNVRYVVEPPVFSTARLPFLSHIPDHTDLSPWHPRLARTLRSYDVIHTTDAFFAYARTATWIARRAGIPLVTSVHTNAPEYGRIYTALTIERLFGKGVLRHFILDRLEMDRRVERRMLRQLADHQRHCDFVLISRPNQLRTARAALGEERVGLLRRGIDRDLFSPSRRNRAWLKTQFGIAPDRIVVLFVGRLSRGKNLMLLTDAVARLIKRGYPLHLFCAGKGNLREAVLARLGTDATCPGALAPEVLAQIYASADLFALPSQIEESANVVPEALASGLPVMVTVESGMGRMIIEGETGRVLPGGNAEAWTMAIHQLAFDTDRRLRMSGVARHYAEARLPSWEQVFAEDVLPHWQAAARGHGAA